jgi:hypothetical protein
MSQYQYYEFQAIDRPLDRAAQDELRSISSLARITATSFTNHYEWGDLNGDPRKFMERWPSACHRLRLCRRGRASAQTDEREARQRLVSAIQSMTLPST